MWETDVLVLLDLRGENSILSAYDRVTRLRELRSIQLEQGIVVHRPALQSRRKVCGRFQIVRRHERFHLDPAPDEGVSRSDQDRGRIASQT